MTSAKRRSSGIAGILLAGTLFCWWFPVAAADFDEQLHKVARDIAGGAAKGRIPRLAVEPFADLEGNVSRLGRVLANELTAELAADRSVQIIDPQQLAAYLGKQQATLLSGLSQDKLAQAGKELGIDGVVGGSVAESANQVRLTVKLISVRSGQLVTAAKTTLPKSGLLAELAEPSAAPSSPPTMAETPPVRTEQSQSPEGMALIPAGPFLFGEGDRQQTIALPAFWIDLFEVTNGRYGEFRHKGYELIEAHRPIVNLSWIQAMQFCRFYGKRLPTEQEWEKAARGDDGRRYPWGDTFDPAVVNSGSRERGATDVGKFEGGRSPYGLYDMAGNVMEWTDSGDNQVKVYRGGSWASPPSDVRTTSRGSIGPSHRLPDLGFRCAMDGPR